MTELKVRLTFIDDILGGNPGNEDIYRTYIGSKAPNPDKIEDEVKALGVEGVVEKGKTIFKKMANGTPVLCSYHIKGFFKAAAQAKKKEKHSMSASLKAFKKEIDTAIFIKEDEIPFIDWGRMDECQRPLRASTPQGERVSIAISESIAAGAQVKFTIQCNVDEDMSYVMEWLDYGRQNGIGQWRNSGKGRFLWEAVPVKCPCCGKEAEIVFSEWNRKQKADVVYACEHCVK